MPKQKQTKAGESPLSFRPSGITRRQLDDLMESLQESQAAVIARAIERLWTMECFSDEKEGA